jgi:hypothetical protein
MKRARNWASSVLTIARNAANLKARAGSQRSPSGRESGGRMLPSRRELPLPERLAGKQCVPAPSETTSTTKWRYRPRSPGMR